MKALFLEENYGEEVSECAKVWEIQGEPTWNVVSEPTMQETKQT